MQSIIKNTVLFTLLYLLTACTGYFLNDDLTTVTLAVGTSNINISPDWQSSNRMFKLPSLKEADYEIVSKPSWLTVGSVSGRLSDSIATVQCSATKNSVFSEVGVYMDFMTVKAEGKNYKVPVAYITEGNPTVQVASSVTLSYNTYGYPTLQIQNTGLGILIWDIASMPDWLAVDTARIESGGMYISQYNSYNIPFIIKPGKITSGSLTGKIVLSTNDKEHPSVTINATVDLGTPQLSINTTAINFASADTSKPISFSNYGSGMLIWEFEDIPEWLTITPKNGMYNPYTSYNNIIFSCDRTKLSAGQNTAIVNLKTNDRSHASHSITVTAVAPGNNENIRAIAGNITDALFNKNTNTLYYVTAAPNKFIAYDITTKTVLHEISLSKAPTSFAISEDWTKAAVGHNGSLSAISLANNTVTATYQSDYSVHDIAWGENDWFCYTQTGGSFSKLHWINTATGGTYDISNNSLDESSIIKKVPNQPYIIGTRNSTSPSGFFSFNIAGKSIQSYSHMDLTNFWMSEDGVYVFARNLNVYRASSSTGSTDTFDADINAIGKITSASGYSYGITFLSQSNHNLWIIMNDYYSSESSSAIFQYEDNDYTLVKKYAYDLLYQPNAQTTSFNVSANYVFANNEGTEIAVLCKGISNSSWLIQYIPVK